MIGIYIGTLDTGIILPHLYLNSISGFCNQQADTEKTKLENKCIQLALSVAYPFVALDVLLQVQIF